MSEQYKRNPYMDYRNVVPFMDLSGFLMRQPHILDEKPVLSLQQELVKKKFSTMINLRRLRYCKLCEEYRNGRR